jgi:hypothetical protein
MALFEPVSLSWGGIEYSIPANRMMRAIAKVEEVITLQQLGNPDAVPMAKISMAYGTLLRYAGAPVTDEAVYEAMFVDGASTPMTATQTLLTLMLPKRIRDKLAKDAEKVAGDPAAEASEGNVSAATPKDLSSKRTRRS